MEKLFQSTLPRGERRSLQGILLWFSYFNPHSHEGSDNRFMHNVLNITYFNPHSHEGATEMDNSVGIKVVQISIHTPTRERLICICIRLFPYNFNPHSHEGATYGRIRHTHQRKAFQSTLPRGSDQFVYHKTNRHQIFQSTLPRGSDGFRRICLKRE